MHENDRRSHPRVVPDVDPVLVPPHNGFLVGHRSLPTERHLISQVNVGPAILARGTHVRVGLSIFLGFRVDYAIDFKNETMRLGHPWCSVAISANVRERTP